MSDAGLVTNEELDHWERLAAAATPGPWDPADLPLFASGAVWLEALDEPPESGTTEGRARRDAAFVAAARTALPALVAEVRRLRMELNRAVRAARVGC